MMAYADTTYLKSSFTALDQSGVDALLVHSLRDAGHYVTGRLAEKFDLPISIRANGALAFTGNPVDGNLLVLGDKTYRFKDTPDQANDISIAASALLSVRNLARAINQRGTGWYTGTEINVDFEAAYPVSDATILLRARKSGTWGNYLTMDASASPVTVTEMSGGSGDYSVLERINGWLAVGMVFRGAASSDMGSAAGSIDLVKDATAQAEEWITHLINGEMSLVDDEGATLAPSTAYLPVSSTTDQVPFADMGDPIYWDYDSSGLWER